MSDQNLLGCLKTSQLSNKKTNNSTIFKKWVKYLNRHSTKDVRQITDKHMRIQYWICHCGLERIRSSQNFHKLLPEIPLLGICIQETKIVVNTKVYLCMCIVALFIIIKNLK